MRTFRSLVRRLGALVVLAVCAMAARADTLHLKDGRVLEGRVASEGEGYVYFVIKVGTIERTELFLRENIAKIERDAPAADPAAKATREAGKEPAAASGNAERVAFVTLGQPPDDMVGLYMNAEALEESFERLEDDKPDIVVLWINSGGGYGHEVQLLSDVIQEQKKNYRIVAWIHSAISAAAMTAITCEEIYFMTKGNLGAATGFVMQAGGAKAIEGEGLEEMLYEMEQISKRGGYDPLIMRAMQVETDLSADVDSNGVVVWRNDLKGDHIVSTKSRILTFNALDAMKYSFAKGIADTKGDLMSLLVGDREWVEVGQDADAYQVEYRKATHDAEIAVNELLAKVQIAIQYAESAQSDSERGRQIGIARRHLNELRVHARKSHGVRFYNDLTDERFREWEDYLRDIATGKRRGR